MFQVIILKLWCPSLINYCLQDLLLNCHVSITDMLEIRQSSAASWRFCVKTGSSCKVAGSPSRALDWVEGALTIYMYLVTMVTEGGGGVITGIIHVLQNLVL